jgi:hypothetical protein
MDHDNNFSQINSNHTKFWNTLYENVRKREWFRNCTNFFIPYNPCKNQVHKLVGRSVPPEGSQKS